MGVSYIDVLPRIKALFFDVDGVLTDGSVQLMADGSQVRTMHAKDGYALQLAAKAGVHICIITGGNSQEVKNRLQNLGIEHIYLSAHSKIDVFEEHIMAYNLQPEECLYMGDDIPDYEVMNTVGLACCPKDAAPEIRSISNFISTKNGGKGCVRDLIEQYLKINENWFKPEVLNTPKAKEFYW